VSPVRYPTAIVSTPHLCRANWQLGASLGLPSISKELNDLAADLAADWILNLSLDKCNGRSRPQTMLIGYPKAGVHLDFVIIDRAGGHGFQIDKPLIHYLGMYVGNNYL
jgi:hypothetical protein